MLFSFLLIKINDGIPLYISVLFIPKRILDKFFSLKQKEKREEIYYLKLLFFNAVLLCQLKIDFQIYGNLKSFFYLLN